MSAAPDAVTVVLIDGPAAGLVMGLPAWPAVLDWPDGGRYEPVGWEDWPPPRHTWGYRWAPAGEADAGAA